MDSIKFYAKSATTALLRWGFIFGLGLMLAIFGIYLAVSLLGNSAVSKLDDGSASGIITYILNLFKLEFWPVLLSVLSIASVFIYAGVASRISLSFIISRLYEKKLEHVIAEKITVALRTQINKPNWSQTINNVSALKEKVLCATGEDSTINKIQHKVIAYAFKKAKLDDIRFSQDNPRLPDDIANRIMAQLSETTTPSYQLLWLVLGMHSLIFVLAFIFDYK